MNVRIRLQGKPEDIAAIKGHLEKIFEIHWTGEYQDFTKRWSKDSGKNPTGKIRIYGYIKKKKEVI